MAKKKNNTTVVNNIDSVNVEIDYEKLAKAMIKAQQEADKQKEIERQKAEEKQREEIIAKRKVILKEKDFSYIKCGFLRTIKTFFNTLRIFINILFLRKEDLKYFTAFDAFVKLITILFMFIIRILLYAIVVVLFVLMFAGFNLAVCIAFAFATFTIAQLLRIATNEIDNIENREYSLAIFSSLIGIVALIVAFATMFVDNGSAEIIKLLEEIKNILIQ